MTDAKAVSQTLRPSATVIALLNAATEQITTLTRERDAMRKDLLNLLAVAHGDGGHHTGSVGLQQSVADAERAFYALRQDAARQLELRYAANRELVALQRETDALKAELAKVPTLGGALLIPCNALGGAAMKSGDRVATGTGDERRPLTLAEAEAGGLPERMTADEWAAMHRASAGTEAKRGAAEVAS